MTEPAAPEAIQKPNFTHTRGDFIGGTLGGAAIGATLMGMAASVLFPDVGFRFASIQATQAYVRDGGVIQRAELENACQAAVNEFFGNSRPKITTINLNIPPNLFKPQI